MSRTPNRRRVDVAGGYAALYAKVPSIECRGRCSDTCTEFPLPRAERRQVVKATGVELPIDPLPFAAAGQRRTCPLLTNFGQCSAYAVRPLICRLWGVSEIFPCNYGCTPAGGRLLSVMETMELIAAAYALSGQTGWTSRIGELRALSGRHVEALGPLLKAVAWGRLSLEEAWDRREEYLNRAEADDV